MAALTVKTGMISTGAGTGDIAYTGVGFTPKLLLQYTPYNSNTEGGASNGRLCFSGASAAAQFAASSASFDSATATTNSKVYYTNQFFVVNSGGPASVTEPVKAAFKSMDADGYTLTYSANANTRKAGYFALAGDDLSVKVGTFNSATATGAQAVTGIGFQPAAVLFISSINDTTEGPFVNSQFMLGCGVSATQRWATQNSGFDNQSASIERRNQVTNKCIYKNVSSNIIAADLTTMDSDGFTLNWTSVTAGAHKISYIALKCTGYTAKAGSLTQPTSTGAQVTSGLGITPSFVILASAMGAASAVETNPAAFALGFGVSSTHRTQMSVQANHNAMDTETCHKIQSSKVLSLITSPGPNMAPTTNAEADVTSLTAGAFTLDWTAADATAREVLYLAFGETLATSSGGRLCLLGAG